MFSLQEYQHVHLLWFKKRSFTLVWKPNPPLRAPSRSCWKHLSSRDKWNLSPPTMCCGWRACFGAAQTMHSHKCDHVKFLLAHSQKYIYIHTYIHTHTHTHIRAKVYYVFLRLQKRCRCVMWYDMIMWILMFSCLLFAHVKWIPGKQMLVFLMGHRHLFFLI